MASNELRMPFAEWLYRMSEARLAPQARELAVYAVVFKVSSNEELAKLAGMDTIVKGESIADKTYNRWKKELTDQGFVILRAITKGRVTTIEVFPAFQEMPVTFTDITPKLARKFYGRNDQSKSYGETVEATDVDTGSPVEVTDETRNSYAPAVEVTAPRACIETSLREVSYTFESEVKNPLGSPKPDADELARQAYELGQRIKQGVATKSARAAARVKGELDGSRGIEFSDGKLTVMNGAAAKLSADFPGIDLAAVCDRAGPEITKMSYPTTDDAMSVLRKWARIVMDEMRKQLGQAKGKTQRERDAEERQAQLKAQNEKLRKEYGFDKEAR
jgi:hypothetical protein